MKSLKSKIKEDMYPWKIESQAQIGSVRRVKPFTDNMIPERCCRICLHNEL